MICFDILLFVNDDHILFHNEETDGCHGTWPWTLTDVVVVLSFCSGPVVGVVNMLASSVQN